MERKEKDNKKTEENKTEENKTEENKTEGDKTERDKTEREKTEEKKTDGENCFTLLSTLSGKCRSKSLEGKILAVFQTHQFRPDI